MKAGTPAAVSNPCCASGLVAHAFEPNIDRPGQDYAHYSNAREPRECKEFCDTDADCKSWTFVVRGVQGPEALCYFKDGIPNAQANDCCTSGVKGAN
jgi:hypothetical protein